MSIQISGPVVPPDGTVTAPKINSGSATVGFVLTADGVAGAAFAELPAAGGGLLASGATVGATAQRQIFTTGVGVGESPPVATLGVKGVDSLTTSFAAKISGATGTGLVVTNANFVGIGTASPLGKLDVNGVIYAGSNTQTVPTVVTIGAYGGEYGFVGANVNVSGGHKYISADYATELKFDTGGFKFRTAPVGVAGNVITFSDALAITNGGNVGIGTISPGSQLHTLLTSAATNAVTNVLTVGHDTTGTAANGFGVGQLLTLESSTTAAQSAARIQALWNDATHATRKADLVLTAYDSGGEREGLRIRGAGSEPALGFYGVAPVARALLATGAGATVDNVITALQNLGLVKQA